MAGGDSPESSLVSQANKRIQEYHAEGERINEAVKVGRVIFDTFNQISERSGGLEKSIWASENHVYSLSEPVLNQGKNKTPTANKEKEKGNEQTPLKNKTTTKQQPKAGSNKPKMEKKTDSVAVNFDNTEAFIGALEKIRLGGKVLKTGQVTKSTPVEDKGNCNPADTPKPAVEDVKCPPIEEKTITPVEEEEDREHMVTFKTWGTPAERPTSTAAPRRIILTGIPVSLRGQSRILSLVHGGRVESIAVHPASQAAEIRFCDAADCKAFYDKHPNGIDVDHNGSRGTVFVDIGKDVDIVSSRLVECLDIGATRVVRAIGAPLDVSIAQLVELIDSKKWQLEKIIDSYEASAKIRTVVFRFCSIDSAVRFRSCLIRLDNWDQANVQFGTDPCEAATGIHWD
ncbi:hypothetical protein MauCBS54593_000729 [Microsporum audouinii]